MHMNIEFFFFLEEIFYWVYILPLSQLIDESKLQLLCDKPAVTFLSSDHYRLDR